MKELKAKLRGYYNYYGVKGNFEGLNEFYQEAMRILRKWLNRRSQTTSFTWEGFNELLKHFKIPRPRIHEAYEDQTGSFVGEMLTAEASITEEPGAEKRHAGICAGAGG